MSKTLLPQNRRQLCVLSGLGGIGKTQLAVEFCRLYSSKFTAVFWLDGSSKDTLNQSIASYANRIPADVTWDPNIAKHLDNDINAVVQAVRCWLEQEDNKRWLIVFDNVDREYVESDHLSYGIQHFIPRADHGSILITTRLIQLGQFGELLEIEKVNIVTAKEIMNSWYSKPYSAEVAARLFEHLDGLPLAIAQAGAFLRESGIDVKTYLRLYEDHREDIAKSLRGLLLQDYPNRSAWTTWSISYDAVYKKDKYAAQLLIFWSFLARNDLWFDLFEKSLKYDSVAERLKFWLGSIPSQEIAFLKAMSLLRSYCLVEGTQVSDGYSMHTVLHQWTYLKKGLRYVADVGTLSLEVVGLAVPSANERQLNQLQRRVLSHGQICLTRFSTNRPENNIWKALIDQLLKEEVGTEAINCLGRLCHRQGEFGGAEKLCEMALKGRERIYGHDDPRTLNIMGSMASLYIDQQRLDKAEQILSKAIHDNVDGPVIDKPRLELLTYLSHLYRMQYKLEKAEQIQKRLLHAAEEMYGTSDPATLEIVNDLAITYEMQYRYVEANSMYERALDGKEAVLGSSHILTMRTIADIAELRSCQGEYEEAECLDLRAYRGFERAVGSNHPSALFVLSRLGNIYKKQKQLDKAENAFLGALKGFELLGPVVKTYGPALDTLVHLGRMYVFEFGKVKEGLGLLKRALDGYSVVKGESSEHCIYLRKLINDKKEDNSPAKTT